MKAAQFSSAGHGLLETPTPSVQVPPGIPQDLGAALAENFTPIVRNAGSKNRR